MKPLSSNQCVFFVTLLLSIFVLLACGSTVVTTHPPDGDGCSDDSNCENGFICDNGTCLQTDGDNGSDGDSIDKPTDGDTIIDGDSPDGDTVIDGDIPDGDIVVDGDTPDGDSPDGDIDTSCVKEGEIGQLNKTCCEGLTKTPSVLLVEEGQCMPDLMCPSCFVCTRCGNHICGLGEDYCNCPKDCVAPDDECTTDADCGQEYCTDDDANNCTQFAPRCENKKCKTDTKTTALQMCGGTKCVDLVCTPGDHTGFECWDQSTVTVCICNNEGNWDCIENPQSECPPVPECGSGQSTEYTCPDNSEVPWCVCDDKCEPVCKFFGTDSEGWYDGCDEKLIAYSDCKDMSVSCLQVGTRSEGWYDNKGLVKYGKCTATWDCNENPEQLCPQENQCEQMGGDCVNADQGCPLGGYGADYSCNSNDKVCCMPGRPPCHEADGICYPFNGDGCPDGYSSTSGVLYECIDESTICCFAENENSCETAGGSCALSANNDCPEGTQSYPPVGCPESFAQCCLPSDSAICQSNEDCGTPSCHVADNGNCVEVIPICGGFGIVPECINTAETFTNSSCIENKCISNHECEDGDEITHTCDNGDVVLWCVCTDNVYSCEADDPEELCPTTEPSCKDTEGRCIPVRPGCIMGTHETGGSCDASCDPGKCVCCKY